MFRIPRHIGIIPDGNRRWAKENGLRKQDGYNHGLLPGLKGRRRGNTSNWKYKVILFS